MPAPAVPKKESPSRMDCAEKNLEETAFEYGLEKPVGTAFVPEAVSVSKAETCAFYLHLPRLSLYLDPDFFLEVTVSPDK